MSASVPSSHDQRALDASHLEGRLTKVRMPPAPCERRELIGLDLELFVIRPSEDERYHCPVEHCRYIGAGLSRVSDCLKHLVDPRHAATHDDFMRHALVCFRNGEERPALYSRASVPAAFSFYDAADPEQKPQHAYTRHTRPCYTCKAGQSQTVVQSCFCCIRSFCRQHAVQEAMHPKTEVQQDLQFFICGFCQHNEQRVAASHIHAQVMSEGWMPQQLYTATGDWVSMYVRDTETLLSPKEFSAKRFHTDLTVFVRQGIDTDRWRQAGKRVGPMYWLETPTEFQQASHLTFAGVHNLRGTVCYEHGRPARGIIVNQSVQKEMSVALTNVSTDALASLQLNHERLSLLRLVTHGAGGVYMYHGVWLIEAVKPQGNSAILELIYMPL